MKLLTRGSLET